MCRRCGRLNNDQIESLQQWILALFTIRLLLRSHWHTCEVRFQLMFDKECLPERLFFVRRKGHFPKFLC